MEQARTGNGDEAWLASGRRWGGNGPATKMRGRLRTEIGQAHCGVGGEDGGQVAKAGWLK